MNKICLTQNELRVICDDKKYEHVYSAGPCCHICSYIYEDTIYMCCYR